MTFLDTGLIRRVARALVSRSQDQGNREQLETGEDDEDVLLYGTVGADGKRGYEVSEYDTSKYNTEEYDVTEYKSVYD